MNKISWDDLNERQQTYLKLIYEYDQIQERNEKRRSARDWNSLPARVWRKIEYADTYSGHTPLKQSIKDAGMVDHGTGSTFKALRDRGLIQASWTHLLSNEVDIWLTANGRKLVRSALNITARTTLPVGTLREWHWRALCRAYLAGDAGVGYDVDTGDGFGYVTWNTSLRLREYRYHGEERPLIAEKRFPGEHIDTVAGYNFKMGYTSRTCITDFGKWYYQENWQRYREMYPEVKAPEPQKI